jgi:hypothetical protein
MAQRVRETNTSLILTTAQTRPRTKGKLGRPADLPRPHTSHDQRIKSKIN